MQRQFLFATVAVAAFSLGVAVAQTGGGTGGTGGSTTSPGTSGGATGGTGGTTQQAPRSGTTGSEKSTGQAPGLEQRGSPPPGVGQGSDRAQERRTGEQPSTQGTTPRSGANGAPTTGGGGELKVTSEQQTRIRSVVSKVNIREVRDVNVNIAVGTVLPSTVELVAVPPELLEIVPEFRTYRVIRVSGRILVVDPGTRRIVYIINA